METTKFQFTKFWLKHDPRGVHVTLSYHGRDLVGEVAGAEYDGVCGCIRLDVRHFNGETWPVRPSAWAVDVLVKH